MKIAIIGKGLAGMITAMAWRAHYPRTEIEIHYDPESPIEPVGSGSWPNLLDLLVDFQTSDPRCWPTWKSADWDQTVKTGIDYEGWGENEGGWFHEFGMHRVSMHFDPQKFCDDMGQYFTLKEGKVGYNIDANYIYDCGGSPFSGKQCTSQSFKNYETLINPLNRVLLAETDAYSDVFCTTKTIATKDGWCFRIPLQSRTSVGYLFNTEITSDEDALKNFEEQFGEHKIIGWRSFHNYMAKNPVIDDRIFLNGNKYFFIEPMEATSVTGYMVWADRTMQHINQGIPLDTIVKENQLDIEENAAFLLYHYSKGSVYNTPFWQYAKELWNSPELMIHKRTLNNIIEMGEKGNWRQLCMNSSMANARMYGKTYNYSYFSFPSVMNCYYNLLGHDYESIPATHWLGKVDPPDSPYTRG